MKIKEINLIDFKRFTDLTIKGIPNTAKLIVLLGPNGCGKSSLFDAFKIWHLRHAYGTGVSIDYFNKMDTSQHGDSSFYKIEFHDFDTSVSQQQKRSTFYFRTAYRNSPEITLRTLNTVYSPLDTPEGKTMIQNDDTVNDNYQRLITKTLSAFYDGSNDEKMVKALRDELLDQIRQPLHRLFPDLMLTEIGLVTDKAEFYFSKGSVTKYGYEKLSGGEKAVFDLLLDFVVKREYYENSIYCIDEPETHIHTALQGKLLEELFGLVKDQSQLWIATHSFGMLKEAKKLKEQYPNEIVFLNFDGYDFDDSVTIEPSECDTVLWNKMLEITLGNYAPFVSPERIVFCEGSNQGRKRKDFDARCYTTIFSPTFPNTMFYSLGSCNDIEEKRGITDFIQKISPASSIIKVIDRDDRSPEEISDLAVKGIKVLSRRHLECFILDDEVLAKWCNETGHPERTQQMLQMKKQAIQDSIARGNPPDDVKSASNVICTEGKKLLGITSCGNNGETIMRDTLSKLITPDMNVYQQLKREIFG